MGFMRRRGGKGEGRKGKERGGIFYYIFHQ
jgi:hypothetical protein